MQKQSKRRTRRIRNLIVLFSLTAIIFSVSTYAWFIGMKTVNVSTFEVEIAATESLSLSLDGTKWGSTVTISKETFKDVAYEDNTNWWAGSGLIPMSSVGVVNTSSSRLELYEKASLTSTAGGYRLLASKVDNSAAEKKGYVAFDLFVRNISGEKYYDELSKGNEEAIYLTTNSEVTVGSAGVANTGIENSVRVAFAEIGRVDATTETVANITGITCSTDSVKKITGICRTATIWEPNDKDHVANAIKWYNKACKVRSEADIREDESYTTTENCSAISNGNYYPTYAVNAEIETADNVDVYDGKEYNGYEATTLLTKFTYFTDSDKIKEGTNRPPFLTLAPSSITKLRVYIYIEGQDIDNYDFASIGKAIAVKFGFTKERFIENDIDYDGPDLDTQAPDIILNGPSTINLIVGDEYTELGATAIDNKDTILPTSITVSGEVNTSEAGTYLLKYNVSDTAGNAAKEVVRTVIVAEEEDEG